MLGFKRFEHAAVTVSGIESAHNIKKGQFDTSRLRLEGARAQEIWQAILAAWIRSKHCRCVLLSPGLRHNRLFFLKSKCG